MTDAELDLLDALAAAATPGPWEATFVTCCGQHYASPGSGGQHTNKNESWAVGPPARSQHRAAADAALVAAARGAIPALVAEVRRLKAEAERVDRDQVR